MIDTVRARRPARLRGWVGIAVVLLVVAAAAGIVGQPASAPAPAISGPAGGAGPPDPASAASAHVAADELLGRDIVDVALLRPSAPGRPPRLLTVEHELSAREAIRLTVLERGVSAWGARAEVTDRPRILGAIATPWLVRLDPRTFVLLAVAPDLGETWLRTVTWSGEEIRLGPRVAVPRPIDDAGAADVDGDGAPELVLVEAATRRRGPTCQGSTILVLDPVSLRVVSELTVPNLRLGAGAVAPLDGSPGDELAATTYRNCPAGPASAERLGFAVVRLGDGEVLVERRLAAADVPTAWSGRPEVADLDADGRPEVVFGSADGAVVVAPSREWAVEAIADLPGVLLGARSAGGGDGAALVVASADGIGAGLVDRSAAGWSVREQAAIGPADVPAEAWAAALVDGRNSALRGRGTAHWSADAGTAGACRPLVVPLATLACGGDRLLVPGPAWFATRPIASFGDPGTILVARSDAWGGVPARLSAPAPLAAEPAAASWRHGPSQPFRLAEADATALRGGSPAAPVVDPLVASDAHVSITAPAGTRILVASGPERAARGRTVPVAGIASVLASSAREGLQLGLHAVDGPADRADPVDPVGLRLPLPVGAPVADPASERSWSVIALAIGPLGEVSATTETRVAEDRTAPTVVFEAPFLTAPWPLTARVAGRTEPQVAVRGPAGLSLAADGSFDLPAQLAPWPQRVEVTVTDRAGNTSIAGMDVVGGIDYRRLPWVPILLIALVGAAILGALRPARGPATVAEPAEDATVLEELHRGPLR